MTQRLTQYEYDSRTDRTNSITKRGEEATSKRVGRAEIQSGTKWTGGTVTREGCWRLQRNRTPHEKPAQGRQIPITFAFGNRRGQISWALTTRKTKTWNFKNLAGSVLGKPVGKRKWSPHP